MASKYQRKFSLEIYSPEQKVLACEAVCVVFPAADGQVGVLANHAPLLAMLGAGAVSVEQPDGRIEEYYVARGFAQMLENTAVILAEKCQPAGTLELEQARNELQTAHDLPVGAGQAARQRLDQINAAAAKVNLAQRQREKAVVK
ncbi:MAG: ATP synthase F1 subunit epsilon [Planctomycetes bacterium]|nr:ATP synthase F1 subunit epsilon [Planctomycetota bacterium]